jgi:hypothetical protein
MMESVMMQMSETMTSGMMLVGGVLCVLVIVVLVLAVAALLKYLRSK